MMNSKYIIIFATILLLCIGAISAAEVSNDTTSKTDSQNPIIKEKVINNHNIEKSVKTKTDKTNPQRSQEQVNTEEVDITSDLEITDDTTYNGKILNIHNGVTVTSTLNITNTSFKITGNNTAIRGINVTNTDFESYVIKTIGVKNVTLENNVISTTKNTEEETKGIVAESSSNVKIRDNRLTLTAVPQGLSWHDIGNDTWVSTLSVSGIVIDDTNDTQITGNHVTMQNATTGLTDYTSMPAISVKNNKTKNILIDTNVISSTGAQNVYGIMLSDGASFINITNNNFTITGEKYTNGINVDTVKNCMISGNIINSTSTGSASYEYGENSIAYGIVVTTWMEGANQYNMINNNFINVTGNITYGMENYMGTINTFDNNTIYAYGNTTIGIGAAGQANNNYYTNNHITAECTNATPGFIYESVTPENAGILLRNCTGNQVLGNTVNITEDSDSNSIYAIILDENTDGNTVKHNHIRATNNNGIVSWGDSATLDNGSNDVDSNYDIPMSSLLTTSTDLNPQQLVVKKKTKTNKESNTIVLNSLTFFNYFTNGLLNDNVSEGDIIDIQGPLDHQKYKITINKPVTLTSTTGDAIIGNGYWRNENNAGNSFTVTKDAAGTNISNIYFNNTQFVLSGTHDININNISVATDTPGIGSGQGLTSIRWSENITVTNSFFKTHNNGGISNLVCAVAKNVLIDNCTIIGEGSVGNLFYITTYNTGYEGEGPANVNITIQNCYINGVNATTQSICQGITIDGTNHTIQNNTLLFNDGVATNQQYGDSYEGQNILINNYIPYGRSILQGWKVYNNTFNDVMVKSGTDFVNNTVLRKINITGEGNNFTGNLWKNKTVNEGVNNENNQYEKNGRIVYIDNNNFNEYFNNNNLIANKIYEGDYLIYNASHYYISIQPKDPSFSLTVLSGNVTIVQDRTNSTIKITILNSYLPNAQIRPPNKGGMVDLINSTFGTVENWMTTTQKFDLLNMTNSYVLVKFLPENTYNLNNSIFMDGILLDSIAPGSNLLVNINETPTNMIFNKPVNIFAPYGAPGVLNGNIILDEDASSNITGLTLNGNLTIKASNVNITNCTINGRVELNGASKVLLDSNIINNQIVLINSLENTITNNIVTTNEDKTIVLDSDSVMNVIRGNDLSASSLFNDKSIQDSGSDNVKESNGPIHATSLSLTAPEGIYPGMDVPVRVEVRSDDDLVDNGYVILLADGVEVDRVTLVNGVADANVKFNESNNKAIIKAYYYPTKYYASSNNWVLRNVKYTNTKVEISDVSLSKIGEEFSVTSIVKDESGNVLTEGEVLFTIGDESFPINITDGQAVLSLTSKEDYYSKVLVVDFAEGNGYASSTNQTSLRFEKGDVIINLAYSEVEEGVITVTANVTDINGNPVSTGYAQFKTTSSSKTVTLADGIASFNITSPETFEEVNVTFKNNPAFVQDIATILVVNESLYDVEISEDEPVIGESTSLSATFFTDDGVLINDGKVIFRVNGKTLRNEDGTVIYANIENGKATISDVNITSEWYKPNTVIQAIYVGNDEFDPIIRETSGVTVVKPTAVVEITSTLEANVGETVTLSASVTDNEKLVNSGRVVFKLNGKTLKDENGKVAQAEVINGVASTDYVIPFKTKAKNYVLTAVFTDTLYQRSEDTADFNIKTAS